MNPVIASSIALMMSVTTAANAPVYLSSQALINYEWPRNASPFEHRNLNILSSLNRLGSDCCSFSGDMVFGASSKTPRKTASLFKATYHKVQTWPH